MTTAEKTRTAAEIAAQAGEIKRFDPEWLVRRGNYLTMITPEVAAELLDRNENNRKPKRRAINLYVRDMMAGNWNPDASDIKVARDGTLIDGQNRCMACVEAGVAFPTLLRTGLDKDAKDHVDQGVRRTVGDTFGMAKLGDPNNTATAVNLRIRYEALLRDGGRIITDKRVQQTHQEAIDYLNTHPMLVKYQAQGKAMHNVGPAIPRSVYYAFMSMIAESSEHMAKEFAEAFISGESSGTGDPLLAMSRYTALQTKNKTGSPGLRGRNMAIKHLLAFVTAWNAWIEGEKLPKIFVRDTDLLVSAV